MPELQPRRRLPPRSPPGPAEPTPTWPEREPGRYGRPGLALVGRRRPQRCMRPEPHQDRPGLPRAGRAPAGSPRAEASRRWLPAAQSPAARAIASASEYPSWPRNLLAWASRSSGKPSPRRGNSCPLVMTRSYSAHVGSVARLRRRSSPLSQARRRPDITESPHCRPSAEARPGCCTGRSRCARFPSPTAAVSSRGRFPEAVAGAEIAGRAHHSVPHPRVLQPTASHRRALMPEARWPSSGGLPVVVVGVGRLIDV